MRSQGKWLPLKLQTQIGQYRKSQLTETNQPADTSAEISAGAGKPKLYLMNCWRPKVDKSVRNSRRAQSWEGSPYISEFYLHGLYQVLTVTI